MIDVIEETEEEILKDINWIRPMQTSEKIREHINELYRGLELSKYPELTQRFINDWEAKYQFKKALEEMDVKE